MQLARCRALVDDGCVFVVRFDLRPDRGAGNARYVSRMLQLAHERGDGPPGRMLARYLGGADGAVAPDEAREAERWCRSLIAEALSSCLERRRHRFIAEDGQVCVFVRSLKAACRVLSSLERELGATLFASPAVVHGSASRIEEIEVFGMRFVPASRGCRMLAGSDVVRKVKRMVRRATARSSALPNAERKQLLSRAVRLGERLLSCADDGRDVAARLNEWMAARVRMLLWKQWKLVRGRISALEGLGLAKSRAFALGAMRHGPWHAAQTVALHAALPADRLRALGFSLFDLRSCAARA